MSRIEYGDDEDYPGQFALWHRLTSMVRRLMIAGMTREEAVDGAASLVLPSVFAVEVACVLGISNPLAWAEQNDEETSRLTPEGRHAAVLAWVRRQLKEQP